jgi:ankyrin repeat protein
MFCTIRRFSILLIAAALMVGTARADGDRLFEAIRSGDVQRVRAAIRAGADVNTRDESGATLLMHAVIHGSRECLRLLLDGDADVNAANRYGSTALMWAGGDARMLKSLLDRGAAVDAEASDGTTALLVAARYGNTESLRLLLEHGARAISPNVREELLRIAYSDPDPTMLRMLESIGLRLTQSSELRGPVVAPNVTQPAVMKRFLALGASPHETAATSTITLSALSYAVGQPAVPAAATLIDHGADPNARGSRGLTPLMMAAAADSGEATTLLLTHGASVDLRDEAGRTALDWALMRGETRVAGILREAGTASMTPPPAAPATVGEPRTARDAVTRAVAKLQAAGPVFYERANCISCHTHSLPAVAVKLARDHGVAVDQALAVHPAQATLADWTRERERNLLAGLPPRGGRAAVVNNLAYGLFALAADEVAPTAVTDAAALRFAALQSADGSWDGGASTFARIRPPLNAAPIPTTALAVRGLSVYAPPGRRGETTRRIARARSYLEKATPVDTQDEAFRLLGLVWARVGPDLIMQQRSRLLALQRPDGGWAQLPTMTSDAYATGQALYALRAAGQSPVTAAYQRGGAYLRRTQLDEGTWFVRSRAVGFLRYFDGGFPHGRDQFISAAATSWAVMALAPMLEARPDDVSSPHVRR